MAKPQSVQHFPVQTSILSSQALIQQVLVNYKLESPIECHFFQQGLNDTYCVNTASGNYFLRVYRYNWRSQQDIEAEIGLLNHLHEQNLPVSTPIQRADGEYINRLNAPEGCRCAVLFSEAKGKYVTMNNRQCYVYGQLVGRVNLASDNIKATYERLHIDLQHLVDEPLTDIEFFLTHRKDDFDYLQSVGQELKKGIESLLPRTKPAYGICHGDHHGGNVHIDENDEMTLFDFDCFGYGWRAYDVSVFLWSRSNFQDWSKSSNAKRTRNWNNFLKGYNEQYQLSANELTATKIFVPIRHLWLMGLHASGSKNWGRVWFNDKYFDEGIDFIRKWIEHYKVLQ